MRVLVTGSTGRVGRAIYVRLCRRHAVIGLDCVASLTADHVGDLTDAATLREALRAVDVVVHTAALHAPQVGRVPDADFERTNVAATRTLVDLAIDAGVRHVVFTSTTALYGAASTPHDAAGWVDETTVPRPVTIYHRTKLAAEGVLATAVRDHPGFGVTVLRMSRCFPEPAPAMAAYRLHRGVDARDVAEAHALAVESAAPGARCFVVSGATPFVRDDVRDLLHDAPAVLARRAPGLVEMFAQRGWPLPASIDRVYDPARAIRDLGYRPRHGPSEVLKMLDDESSEVLPLRVPSP